MGWRVGLKWHNQRWKEPLKISCRAGTGLSAIPGLGWLDPFTGQQHFRKWSVCSCCKPHKVLLGSLSRNSTQGRSCALSTPLTEGTQTESAIYRKMCRLLAWGREKECSRTQLQCQRALVVFSCPQGEGGEIISFVGNKLNWLLSRCTSATV